MNEPARSRERRRGRGRVLGSLLARSAHLVASSALAGASPRGGAGTPTHADDIDAAWMTAALEERFPGVRVRDVRSLETTEGTTRRARIALELDPPGKPAAPGSVFVKLSPSLGHRALLTGLGLIEGEVRFYRDLRSEISIRAPDALHIDYHRPSARFALVLTDVSGDGTRFGLATEPLGRDEAAAVLEGLGRLHGAYWASPRFDGDLAWLETPTVGAFSDFYTVVPMPLRKGLRRAGDAVPAALADPGLLLDAYRRLQLRNGREPLTLVHGDPHVGNLYFPSDGEPGFLDWQVVRRARWAHDVGYFLVSALSVEDRRRYERELLEHYRTILAREVPDAAAIPSGDDLWTEYRCQAAYGLAMWVGTLALGDYQTDAVSGTNVGRFAAAATDLETIALLADD